MGRSTPSTSSGPTPDDHVERSLYSRATGYEFDAVKIFCNKDGVVTKVKYRQHLPPDTVACIYWLNNRRKEKWRNQQTTEQPLAFDPNESIEDIRDELLRDMAEAGQVLSFVRWVGAQVTNWADDLVRLLGR
jgi:hypothetical protein